MDVEHVEINMPVVVMSSVCVCMSWKCCSTIKKNIKFHVNILSHIDLIFPRTNFVIVIDVAVEGQVYIEVIQLYGWRS